MTCPEMIVVKKIGKYQKRCIKISTEPAIIRARRGDDPEVGAVSKVVVELGQVVAMGPDQ